MRSKAIRTARAHLRYIRGDPASRRVERDRRRARVSLYADVENEVRAREVSGGWFRLTQQ